MIDCLIGLLILLMILFFIIGVWLIEIVMRDYFFKKTFNNFKLFRRAK